LTDRTALDVNPGDAEHQLLDRFWRCGGRRRRRQEGPALGERRRAPPIGEQAEVADAHEAGGDNVEEEATEKLLSRKLPDLHAVGVGVVAPAEADAAAGEGEQPVVGEGHAVRVAAEVGEHVRRAGERRLAVDDPGLLA